MLWDHIVQFLMSNKDINALKYFIGSYIANLQTLCHQRSEVNYIYIYNLNEEAILFYTHGSLTKLTSTLNTNRWLLDQTGLDATLTYRRIAVSRYFIFSKNSAKDILQKCPLEFFYLDSDESVNNLEKILFFLKPSSPLLLSPDFRWPFLCVECVASM